jgi:elongation factor P
MVVYFQFVKPGKGIVFMCIKFKYMVLGNVLERTYRTGETLIAADVEEESMQYLYNDGEFYHFMNEETYDQVAIPAKSIADEANFLVENDVVDVLYYKGAPLIITLPNFIESEVTYCEPGVRGNTAQGATKPATLACGATINVPLFIDQGEVLKIDTRTKEYVSRVQK